MKEISPNYCDPDKPSKIYSNAKWGRGEGLSQFFKANKDSIRAKLQENLRKSSIEPCYCSYLLEEPDGLKRVGIYIDLFELALKGDVEPFIEDQKSIGYIRAMEGYKLNDVFEFTMAFKDALWRTSRDVNEKSVKPLKNSDIFRMLNILDHSFFHLSRSFIRTRDEIIARHRDQLQRFQQFSAKVVSVFDDQKIWSLAIQGVLETFNLRSTFLSLNQSDSETVQFTDHKMMGSPLPYDHVEEIINIMVKAPPYVGD